MRAQPLWKKLSKKQENRTHIFQIIGRVFWKRRLSSRLPTGMSVLFCHFSGNLWTSGWRRNLSDFSAVSSFSFAFCARDCWNKNYLRVIFVSTRILQAKFSLCFYPASVQGIFFALGIVGATANGGSNEARKRGTAKSPTRPFPENAENCFFREIPKQVRNDFSFRSGRGAPIFLGAIWIFTFFSIFWLFHFSKVRFFGKIEICLRKFSLGIIFWNHFLRFLWFWPFPFQAARTIKKLRWERWLLRTAMRW